jgi:signal transduction histidine kinase
MDNLLFWSRDLLKGDQGKFMDVNVYEAIQQNISIHSDKLLSKKIVCQNLVSPMKKVRLDVNTLNLCLRNMISNAIKFTPAMGLVEIGFNKENGFAVFFVSDNGIGISEERQKKLSSLEVDSVKGTIGEQGTGVGLHFVKEFLEKSGGSIICESKPDRGSTFIFSLPIQ